MGRVSISPKTTKMRRWLLTSWLAITILSVSAQNVKIKGRVVNAQTKEAIGGATVSIKGMASGSITDTDGNYAISGPANGTIVFSFVGFKTLSTPIDGKENVNVELAEDAAGLDEVVVIGYGGQKRSSLSTSVSNVKIGDEMRSQPTSLFSKLQGQIAGVTISQNGGDPLSGPSIVIRGQGSRSGDPVLYVVDGVPGAPYNEQDVETVTVLKDAAAAAIYGANVGSGGVIIITTKKAKAGKTVITAKAQTGYQQAYKLPKVLTAEQYNKVMADAATVSGVPIPVATDQNIYPWGNTTRTDWLDEIFRTGSMQNYAVSISDGNERLQGLASFEYNKVEGTLLNTFSKSMGLKTEVNFQPYKWLKVSQKISYRYDNGQGGVNNSGHTGVISAAMFYPRSATVYEMTQAGEYVLDGNGNKIFGGTVPLWAKNLGVAGSYGEVQNPVATLMRLNQNRPNNSVFSTTSFAVNPIEYLTVKSDLTVNGYLNHYEDFVAKKPEIGKPDLNNSRTISNYLGYGYLSETIISYERMLNKHLISLMTGASFKYNQNKGNSTTLKGFDKEDTNSQDFINGTNWTDIKPTEAFSEEATTGFFARGSYSFDDRYFMVASIRRDASSKLYKDNNYGVFPAFSGAWKASSEDFFKNQKVISMLKFRGSWGRVGNVSSVNNYSYISSLVQTGDGIYLGNNGQTFIKGVGLATIPNMKLKWETAEQTNFGVDMAILQNRLEFSADYYIKKTRDLIDQLPVPSVAGLMEAPFANVGMVENNGWEFTATYSDKTKGGLFYSISANAAFQKNTVKDLGVRDFYAHSNSIRAMQPLRSKVGESWYSYYLIKTDGIFQTQAEIDSYVDKTGKKIQPNAIPGDLKFVDYDGNGVINDNDRQYLGSYAPKYTYGLTANLEYKGFDCSVQIQGVNGNKIFNGVKLMTYAPGQGWNLSSDVLNSWGYNKSSTIPLLSMSDKNGNTSTPSDFFLEDGSYCRIKNITIGYTIPATLFGNANKVKARVFASGQNLLTITKYSGMDPEVGNQGLDGGTYPVSRIFSVGLNLTF